MLKHAEFCNVNAGFAYTHFRGLNGYNPLNMCDMAELIEQFPLRSERGFLFVLGLGRLPCCALIPSFTEVATVYVMPKLTRHHTSSAAVACPPPTKV
jgi:hypothetical protein